MDPFAGTGSPVYKGSGKVPKGTGRQHIGKPYQVAGRWFTPKAQPGYDKLGPASWYGEAFHRRKTSNGEWFDMNELTAAHPTLPLPSYAKVTNQENGRTVIVRINDRGPFVGPRIIDMSKRSAEVLGFKTQGKTTVRVQYLGPAPVGDTGRHLMAMNQQLGQGASVRELAQMAKGRDIEDAPQIAERQVEDGDTTLVSYSEQRAPTLTNAYTITVASFNDPENATATRDALADQGARVVQVDTDVGEVYKVIIGPITNRRAVQQAMEAVTDAGFNDASVVSTRIQQVASQ